MKNFRLNNSVVSRWFRALGVWAVLGWALGVPFLLAQGTNSSVPATSEAEGARGRDLYLKNCFACHQMRGQGIPGVFPPLAGSDYLLADIDRAIRIVCEGLNGEITVNARRYAGVMPPAILQDEEVASVLNYVLRNWGNAGPEVTSEQVKKVRATTAYPTFEALQQANRYPPLPKAPEGFACGRWHACHSARCASPATVVGMGCMC